jgi:hypothetical protein
MHSSSPPFVLHAPAHLILLDLIILIMFKHYLAPRFKARRAVLPLPTWRGAYLSTLRNPTYLNLLEVYKMKA